MVAWLVGAALALPPALLGADGPTWVGTLPPGSGLAVVAVVDPESGNLIVESVGADGRTLNWNGEEWTVDGEALNADEPAVGHRMDAERLLASETLLSSTIQYDYSSEGQLAGLRWANGEQMVVRYQDDGRVDEILGPGTRRLQLSWVNGLRWTDALGRSLQRTQVDVGPTRTVTVSDALGRQAIARYRQREQEWVLTGWTDPRGLEARIGRYGDRMDVTAPGGRVYRMEVGPAGEVRSVVMPGGQRWQWEYDEAGELQRMVDPAGRVTRLERDDDGRVVSVSPSGRVKRVQRNADGAVVAFISATGAATQFIRDEQNNLRTIVDAAGNQLFIERSSNGWPSAVLERNGARWNLSMDTLGRPDRIEDSVGRVIHVHRNGPGRIERIVDSDWGEVRLEYESSGRLSAVVSAEGRRTQFHRDAAGRVTRVTRPDESELHLERSPVGEVTAVRLGSETVKVERSSDGQVRSVGAQRWTRDINGRVQAIEGRMGRWEMARDPAGWIRRIEAGDWWVDIDRDANGWPVRWNGSDGTIDVQRDGSGRTVRETGDVERRVLRDPRGLPVRVVAGAVGEWRTQRDASGRVLTVRAPEGVALSAERDPLGEPKWFRFPDGTIVRRSQNGNAVDDVMVGPAGTVVGRHRTTFDSDGRPIEEVLPGGDAWSASYDMQGRLTSISAGEGAGWLWENERVLDPSGRLQLNDSSGLLMEAQLPPGPPAWGLASGMISVLRDRMGHINGLSGDAGVAPVTFDALGRLEGFRPANSSGWSLRYDARGRPAAVAGPNGTTSLLLWHPDALSTEGMAGVLATGPDASVPWAVLDGGMAARRNAMDIEGLVVDAMGTPAWILDGSGGAATLLHTPMGLPGQEAGGPMGLRGRVQWFPGGPIQVGAVALDPVSGQRVDGHTGWPWSAFTPWSFSPQHAADPGPWAPTSRWSDPLSMLMDLGVLKPVVEGDWRAVTEVTPAFEGLPASIDGASPPLGPDRETVPFETDDPITEWLVQCLLPGGSAPSTDGLVGALISSELALPWLPPDVEIPGLEEWRRSGFFAQE